MKPLILTLILLPALANAKMMPDGLEICNVTCPVRTPSLNGGNSTVLGHENDRHCCGATSRERVQIAVSGVHQLPIDGNQPVIVISDTRTYGERVDLGYVQIPKKRGGYGR